MTPRYPLPVIAIHGGAGTLNRSQISAEQHAAFHSALENTLRPAQQLLAAGGGLIAVDAQGHLSLPFNAEGMYRGWARVGEPQPATLHGRHQVGECLAPRVAHATPPGRYLSDSD